MRAVAAGLLAFALVSFAQPHPQETPARAAVFTPTDSPLGPGGVKAAIDLPASQHLRNTGGVDVWGRPGKGLGLCVFTSVEVAARWQNVRVLDGFQHWMTFKPGGGWPEKLDAVLNAFCKERGVRVPAYVQHTGGDVAFLELCVKTRRMAAITYSGHDDFYAGRVSHMVNLAHLDEKLGAIIDNNRPGHFVWMDRQDLVDRWEEGSGWAVALLAPPPPPAPATSTPKIIGQCPDGRCPMVPIDPANIPPPIGNPPSPDHEWGIIPGHGWGWRFKSSYGVETGKIARERHYWINGEEVSREEALAAVAAEGLKDDSAKPSLSIVAPAARAAAVRQALADPRVAPLAAKCHVQIYAPDDWVAKDRLSATITLQAPGGAVIGSASVLAQDDLLVEQLRALLDPQPPPPPKVDPPAPTPQPGPAPSPCPCPQPCPCPGPSPCPCPGPTPAPVPAESPKPNILVSLLALLASLFIRRK